MTLELHTMVDACHRHLLARRAIGAVEMCQCGAVHLSIGGVTLRLVPAAVMELAELLGQAAAELPDVESALERRAPAEARS